MRDVPIFDPVEAFRKLLNDTQKQAFEDKFPEFHDQERRKNLTVNELYEIKKWIMQHVRWS